MDDIDYRDARNLQTRMDDRDIETFRNDIRIRTQREGILIREWLDHEKFDLEDAGADNSGGLITQAAMTSRKPDFRVIDKDTGEVTYIEVKNSFHYYIATFKESDLNFYMNFEHPMIMLVFVGTGMQYNYQMIPDHNTEWFIVKKEEIPKVIEVAHYEPWGHNRFGRKASYRLSRCQDQFDIFETKVTRLYR